MSIFKWRDQADAQKTGEQGDVEQTGAAPAPEMEAPEGQLEQPANPMSPILPPFVAPGVVPPPAAPVYSVRPPASAPRADGDGERLVAETVRMAREAKQMAQEIVEEAVERREPRPSLPYDRRRGGEGAPAAPPAPPAVQRARAAAPAAQDFGRRSTQRGAPVASRATWPRPRQTFDAVRCAQSGLLNLAWAWQEAGSPIRAIHAYMQVLQRYPHTAAADAAVADLVEISDKLAMQGQFHTALAIYDQLEELLA
jgi:hypothetical protein